MLYLYPSIYRYIYFLIFSYERTTFIIIFNSFLKVQEMKEPHVIATEVSLRFHKVLTHHGQFSDIVAFCVTWGLLTDAFLKQVYKFQNARLCNASKQTFYLSIIQKTVSKKNHSFCQFEEVCEILSFKLQKS